jgi:hypothetical protein
LDHGIGVGPVTVLIRNAVTGNAVGRRQSRIAAGTVQTHCSPPARGTVGWFSRSGSPSWERFSSMSVLAPRDAETRKQARRKQFQFCKPRSRGQNVDAHAALSRGRSARGSMTSAPQLVNAHQAIPQWHGCIPRNE